MKSRFNRSAAIVTAHLFLFNTICWASPAIPAFDISSLKNTDGIIVDSPLAKLAIPESLGAIKEISHPESASAASFIVHIEDAHASLDAQDNIKKILNHVTQNSGIDLIFVEGAIEQLDPKQIRFFQDESLNMKMAELLLKSGFLSGSGLFLFERDQPSQTKAKKITALGVEDARLYRQNLTAYREVLREKQNTEQFSENLARRIMTQGTHVFNKKLQSFFREWVIYQDRPNELTRQLETLRRFSAEELNLDLLNPREQLDWPQLVRYFRLQKVQGEQNPEKANEEIEQLIIWAEKQSLPEKEIEVLREWQNRKMVESGAYEGLRSFLEHFYGLSAPKGFSYQNYPSLSKEWGRSILQSELHAEELFEEIHRLTEKLLEQLAATDEERALLSIYKDSRLLKKALTLELSSEDYNEVKKRGNQLLPSEIEKRLGSVSALKIGAVDQTFQKALLFYNLAQKRDQAIYENLSKKLKALNKKNAILVTGGFHSRGLHELFKQNEIAYVDIVPHIADLSSQAPYSDVLLKKYNPLIKSSYVASPQILDPTAVQSAGYEAAYTVGGIYPALGSVIRDAVQAGSDFDLLIAEVNRFHENVIIDPTTGNYQVNGKPFIVRNEQDQKWYLRLTPDGVSSAPVSEATVAPSARSEHRDLKDLRHVLYVDSAPFGREKAAKAFQKLQNDGIISSKAVLEIKENGEEALAQTRKDKPDVVIVALKVNTSKYVQTISGGFVVARNIHEEYPLIPIVIVDTDPDTRSRQSKVIATTNKARDAGIITGWIGNKPTTSVYLQHALEQAGFRSEMRDIQELRRVLYVDDDADYFKFAIQTVSKMRKSSLLPKKMEIKTAENGIDALAEIKAWQPDVVFLDLEMYDSEGKFNKIAGLELAEKIHKSYPDIVVVITTFGGLDHQTELQTAKKTKTITAWATKKPTNPADIMFLLNLAGFRSEMRDIRKLRRVLYVDDTEDFLDFAEREYRRMRGSLLSQEAVIETEKNGKDVLKKIEADQPDVVFLDLEMYDSEGKFNSTAGLELAEKIYEKYPDIVIVITTFGAISHLAELQNAKERKIIKDWSDKKPVSPGDIISLLILAGFRSEMRETDEGYLLPLWFRGFSSKGKLSPADQWFLEGEIDKEVSWFNDNMDETLDSELFQKILEHTKKIEAFYYTAITQLSREKASKAILRAASNLNSSVVEAHALSFWSVLEQEVVLDDESVSLAAENKIMVENLIYEIRTRRELRRVVQEKRAALETAVSANERQQIIYDLQTIGTPEAGEALLEISGLPQEMARNRDLIKRKRDDFSNEQEKPSPWRKTTSSRTSSAGIVEIEKREIKAGLSTQHLFHIADQLILLGDPLIFADLAELARTDPAMLVAIVNRLQKTPVLSQENVRAALLLLSKLLSFSPSSYPESATSHISLEQVTAHIINQLVPLALKNVSRSEMREDPNRDLPPWLREEYFQVGEEIKGEIEWFRAPAQEDNRLLIFRKNIAHQDRFGLLLFLVQEKLSLENATDTLRQIIQLTKDIPEVQAWVLSFFSALEDDAELSKMVEQWFVHMDNQILAKALIQEIGIRKETRSKVWTKQQALETASLEEKHRIIDELQKIGTPEVIEVLLDISGLPEKATFDLDERGKIDELNRNIEMLNDPSEGWANRGKEVAHLNEEMAKGRLKEEQYVKEVVGASQRDVQHKAQFFYWASQLIAAGDVAIFGKLTDLAREDEGYPILIAQGLKQTPVISQKNVWAAYILLSKLLDFSPKSYSAHNVRRKVMEEALANIIDKLAPLARAASSARSEARVAENASDAHKLLREIYTGKRPLSTTKWEGVWGAERLMGSTGQLKQSSPSPQNPLEIIERSTAIGLPVKESRRQNLTLEMREMTDAEKKVYEVTGAGWLMRWEFDDEEHPGERLRHYSYVDQKKDLYKGIGDEGIFFLQMILSGAKSIEGETLSQTEWARVLGAERLMGSTWQLKQSSPSPQNPLEIIERSMAIGLPVKESRRQNLKIFAREMTLSERRARNLGEYTKGVFLFWAEYEDEAGKKKNHFFYSNGDTYLKDEILNRNGRADTFAMIQFIGQGNWKAASEIFNKGLWNYPVFWRDAWIHRWIFSNFVNVPNAKIKLEKDDFLLFVSKGPMDQALAPVFGKEAMPPRIVVDATVEMKNDAAQTEEERGLSPKALRVIGNMLNLPIDWENEALKIPKEKMNPPLAADLEIALFKLVYLTSRPHKFTDTEGKTRVFTDSDMQETLLQIRKTMQIGGVLVIPADGRNYTPEYLASMRALGFLPMMDQAVEVRVDEGEKHFLDLNVVRGAGAEIEKKLGEIDSRFMAFELVDPEALSNDALRFPMIEREGNEKSDAEREIGYTEHPRIDFTALDWTGFSWLKWSFSPETQAANAALSKAALIDQLFKDAEESDPYATFTRVRELVVEKQVEMDLLIPEAAERKSLILDRLSRYFIDWFLNVNQRKQGVSLYEHYGLNDLKQSHAAHNFEFLLEGILDENRKQLWNSGPLFGAKTPSAKTLFGELTHFQQTLFAARSEARVSDQELIKKMLPVIDGMIEAINARSGIFGIDGVEYWQKHLLGTRKEAERAARLFIETNNSLGSPDDSRLSIERLQLIRNKLRVQMQPGLAVPAKPRPSFFKGLWPLLFGPENLFFSLFLKPKTAAMPRMAKSVEQLGQELQKAIGDPELSLLFDDAQWNITSDSIVPTSASDEKIAWDEESMTKLFYFVRDILKILNEVPEGILDHNLKKIPFTIESVKVDGKGAAGKMIIAVQPHAGVLQKEWEVNSEGVTNYQQLQYAVLHQILGHDLARSQHKRIDNDFALPFWAWKKIAGFVIGEQAADKFNYYFIQKNIQALFNTGNVTDPDFLKVTEAIAHALTNNTEPFAFQMYTRGEAEAIRRILSRNMLIDKDKKPWQFNENGDQRWTRFIDPDKAIAALKAQRGVSLRIEDASELKIGDIMVSSSHPSRPGTRRKVLRTSDDGNGWVFQNQTNAKDEIFSYEQINQFIAGNKVRFERGPARSELRPGVRVAEAIDTEMNNRPLPSDRDFFERIIATSAGAAERIISESWKTTVAYAMLLDEVAPAPDQLSPQAKQTLSVAREALGEKFYEQLMAHPEREPLHVIQVTTPVQFSEEDRVLTAFAAIAHPSERISLIFIPDPNQGTNDFSSQVNTAETSFKETLRKLGGNEFASSRVRFIGVPAQDGNVKEILREINRVFSSLPQNGPMVKAVMGLRSLVEQVTAGAASRVNRGDVEEGRASLFAELLREQWEEKIRIIDLQKELRQIGIAENEIARITTLVQALQRIASAA